MNSKVCTKCKETKLLAEFYRQADRKNGYSFCKQCFNQYCLQKFLEKKKNAIIYKGSKCKNCPISYPEYPYVVFDFHHRNPAEKEFDWYKLRLHSWKRIIKELDKCDLLCSNCHRIIHHIVSGEGFEPPVIILEG